MKKGLVVSILMLLFIASFAAAFTINTRIIEKLSENESSGNESNHSLENKVNSHDLGDLKEIIAEKHRIHAALENGSCPDNCTCSGSTVKCFFSNGSREMTIFAGKSGNIIIQVKGINATTNVTLYKSDDGKIYAVKKNNETIVVRLLPDQVAEKIRERFQRQFENENITLDENGTYDYDGEKNVTVFFFFHAREKIRAEFNSSDGNIINIKNPWWAFLAKDTSQPIVGASCGTVTPGQNDNCCKAKDYDFWNTTAAECQFSS